MSGAGETLGNTGIIFVLGLISELGYVHSFVVLNRVNFVGIRKGVKSQRNADLGSLSMEHNLYKMLRKQKKNVIIFTMGNVEKVIESLVQ